MQRIDSFSGQHRFLSNFWESSPITIHLPTLVGGGMVKDAKTVEHAFQALKASNADDFFAILTADTPGKAKRLGRKVAIRDDWDEIRVQVMLACLQAKFRPGTPLAEALLATGHAELIEGNTWGDRFWGVCGGEGKNILGCLLMLVRAELLAASAASLLPSDLRG